MGPQLVALFWEVIEFLGGKVQLEKVGGWGGNLIIIILYYCYIAWGLLVERPNRTFTSSSETVTISSWARHHGDTPPRLPCHVGLYPLKPQAKINPSSPKWF